MPQFVNEARAKSALMATLALATGRADHARARISVPVTSSWPQRSAEVYDVAPEVPADFHHAPRAYLEAAVARVRGGVAEGRRALGSVAPPFCCLPCLLGNERRVLIGIAA